MRCYFLNALVFTRVLPAITIMVATGVLAEVVLAQGAVQAVRQRVEGLGAQPAERRTSPPIDAAPSARESSPPRDAAGGAIDIRFVTPSATAIAVVRPAQIMTSAIGEMLPIEVATAAGLKHLGIDPAHVEEMIAFFDISTGMGYGVTVRFNQPFRGAAIPPERRAHTQLAELAGRKYLQSTHPMLPSFYGPNSTTLIAAPDATLRQLLQPAGGGSGPLVDFVRGAGAGNDLYVAIDLASLRPMLAMQLAPLADQLPAEVKPFLDVPNLATTIELTLNLTPDRPTSLVVHATDEAAAAQLESLFASAMAQYQEKVKTLSAGPEADGDAIQQALSAYQQRISKRWAEATSPRREGARLTFFDSENDPEEQQMRNMFAIGMLVGRMAPILEEGPAALLPQGGSAPVSEPAADPPPGAAGGP